jgi:hypothetical protein
VRVLRTPREVRNAIAYVLLKTPRTRLLTVGWKRSGLLDPDETPGRRLGTPADRQGRGEIGRAAVSDTSFRRLAQPPGLFALMLASIAHGCTTPAPTNHLYHQSAAGFQAGLVLPLNAVEPIGVSMPKEVGDRAEPVEHVLRGYLTERGKSIEIIPRSNASGAWSRIARECAFRAVDVCEGFERRLALLAIRLREQHDYEVLIIPYLLFRPAKGKQTAIRWDGVVRRLEKKLGATTLETPRVTGEIAMSGLSLGIIAVSSDGVEVFEGVGGLELPFRMHVSHVIRFEMRDDLFADPTLLREGVAIALDPLVPRSHADVH